VDERMAKKGEVGESVFRFLFAMAIIATLTVGCQTNERAPHRGLSSKYRMLNPSLFCSDSSRE
jgi:hypothetical protein